MEEINNPVSNSIPRNKIERELMLANIDLDRSPDISFEKYVEYNKLLVNALNSFANATSFGIYFKSIESFVYKIYQAKVITLTDDEKNRYSQSLELLKKFIEGIGTFIDTYGKTGSFKLTRKEPKPKDKTTNNQKRY